MSNVHAHVFISIDTVITADKLASGTQTLRFGDVTLFISGSPTARVAVAQKLREATEVIEHQAREDAVRLHCGEAYTTERADREHESEFVPGM